MSVRQLRRCTSNQLLSLLDWAGSHVMPNQLGQQLRFASTSANQKAIQYARERKTYESNLSELRKEWAKQEEAAAKRRASEAEAVEARRRAAKSQRARDDAADKETRRKELLARQQADRELRVSSTFCVVSPAASMFIYSLKIV